MLPKRKPNRLLNYDYSQNGAYFITFCTKDKAHILWNVGATCGRPQALEHLSSFGLVVSKEIEKIPFIYDGVVKIDKYVVMPNHIHLIPIIDTFGGRPQVAPTVSRVIQQFKGSVTKQTGRSIWQKFFHDHIIRNENDYQMIWQYIDCKPLTWKQDCFYTGEN